MAFEKFLLLHAGGKNVHLLDSWSLIPGIVNVATCHDPRFPVDFVLGQGLKNRYGDENRTGPI
jgi:hypothetical protein